MDEQTVPEFREQAADSSEESPVVAQYGDGGAGGGVRNEVRGHVSGAVVQIAGDHYGGLSL